MPRVLKPRTLLAPTVALCVAAGAALALIPAWSRAAAAPAQTEVSLGSGGAGPSSLAVGSSGALWFLGGPAGSGLDELAAGGQLTSFSQQALGGNLVALAADTAGDVWFTESGVTPPPTPPGVNVAVGFITPAGSVTRFSSGLIAGDQPGAIALGPDGNMWFVIDNGPSSAIGRVTAAGVITRFTGSGFAGAQPGAITAGPDGNVWFTLTGGSFGGTGAIGRITPAGVITIFTAGLAANGQPRAITGGPDGDVWFLLAQGPNPGSKGEVGSISPDGTITDVASLTIGDPRAIAGGADGNLYVAEHAGSGSIAQVTPAGVVNEPGGLTGHPQALAADAAGQVWFATSDPPEAGNLGLTITAPPGQTGPPGATGPPVASGPRGATGPTGTTGATGSGATGTTGSQPPRAPQGQHPGGPQGGAGSGGPGTSSQQPGAAAGPVLGRTAEVNGSGTVLVQLSPSGPAVPLTGSAEIPDGALVNATHGTVSLTTALPGGTRQTARVWGGTFRVRQPAGDRGMTQLVLAGGNLAGCAAMGARTGGAHYQGRSLPEAEAAKSAPTAPPLRSLWSSDHDGRYQTYGRNSVGTVRGTVWFTEDTCAGTITRVARGVVSVLANGSHHPVRVTPGHSYLAPNRG